MAAITATPDRVLVGFRTSIFRRPLSWSVAVAKISALLGKEESPNFSQKAFFMASRSAWVLTIPERIASTIPLSSPLTLSN